MKLKLIVIFLISFITISSQSMLNYEKELLNINLGIEPITKPQNKFVANKQINNRALIFISGTTLTAVGITQIIRARNSNFDLDKPKGAIPLNPHNILIGVGLFTMSFSFVIS